jgi:hypothetical protein
MAGPPDAVFGGQSAHARPIHAVPGRRGRDAPAELGVAAKHTRGAKLRWRCRSLARLAVIFIAPTTDPNTRMPIMPMSSRPARSMGHRRCGSPRTAPKARGPQPCSRRYHRYAVATPRPPTTAHARVTTYPPHAGLLLLRSRAWSRGSRWHPWAKPASATRRSASRQPLATAPGRLPALPWRPRDPDLPAHPATQASCRRVCE